MPRRPRINTGDPLADAALALSPRDKALVESVLSGTPVRTAYEQAGFAQHQGNAYRKLSQPNIQAYMLASLERKGFGVPEVAQVLIDAATKAQSMQLDREGNEHLIDDHRTRIQAADVIGKWVGAIGPRDRNEGPAVSVNIYVGGAGIPGHTVDADTFHDVTEGEILSEESS